MVTCEYEWSHCSNVESRNKTTKTKENTRTHTVLLPFIPHFFFSFLFFFNFFLLYFIGFKRLPIRLLKLMDGAMTSMFWHNWMWHVLSLPIVFIFYINFWKKNKKCHNTYLLLKITALLLLWHNDLIDTSLIIIKTKYYIMSP